MASQLLNVPHLAFFPKISYASVFSTLKPSFFHSTSTRRALKSSPSSRIINLQAVAETSSEIESNSVTETTVPLTLRQICQGFVPEHILHRQASFLSFYFCRILNFEFWQVLKIRILWIDAEWRRLDLSSPRIFKEKLFLLCLQAVIASSMLKSFF